MGNRNLSELSANELHQLVREQHTYEHQARLEHFRKTGRIASEYNLAAASTVESKTIALPKRSKARFGLLDGLLLLIELAAVVGLIYLILNGMNVLTDLNRQVISAIKQPTLIPTPLISAVVLPAGHTPPDASGKAEPNDAEIPRHLLPLVQSLKNIPIPTPSIEQSLRIQVPVIHLDAPVIQGDDWEQLKKGVGQRIGTPNAGQTGNIVLSAHNDIFGEIFRDLDQLKAGEEIILFTSQRTYTYRVTSLKITEPTDVAVMDATIDPTLTLISCYPYRIDNQRIVVTTKLDKP